MNRNEIVSMLAKHGVTLGSGFAFRMDNVVEEALAAWTKRGSPRRVHIEANSEASHAVKFIFIAY